MRHKTRYILEIVFLSIQVAFILGTIVGIFHLIGKMKHV